MQNPQDDQQKNNTSAAGNQNPTPEEDKTPANYQLGSKLPAEIKIKLPAHNLQFDEQKFLKLLAGSISITKQEKIKIIESVPNLKIEQVNELMSIFEEEKEKFAQLPASHVTHLEKIAEQQHRDWVSIENSFQMQEKKAQDESEADQIRKSLGL